jgi:pimeloyl-ACP methyl ester carboxylesterase
LEGVRKSFWPRGMMAGFPAAYFCIKAFSETELTEDLRKIDVPTLILHHVHQGVNRQGARAEWDDHMGCERTRSRRMYGCVRQFASAR